MKLKILYLILFILIFIPIGLCEKIENVDQINNIKIYDKNDKIISIYDKNNDKSMDIKLISTISDINKFTKIIEITNYIEYIPDRKKDFITNTNKIYGKNNIYKIEYFIEKYNYIFDYIIINETFFNNKTGKNETKLINKSIIKDIKPFWVEFKPYDKTMFKNEKFKLKIIHYKKSELGFFKIQTIPIFKNIECKEFTWWLGNWNLKRSILINNTYGDNVTDYQLKSVNLSQYQINALSTRIINETSGLQESFWNESIDSNGNLEFVWCNFSKINNGSWINDTYSVYYQNIPIVNGVSDGDTTFWFFDDFEDDDFTVKWNDISIGDGIVSESGGKIRAYGNNLAGDNTGAFESKNTIVPAGYRTDIDVETINIILTNFISIDIPGGKIVNDGIRTCFDEGSKILNKIISSVFTTVDTHVLIVGIHTIGMFIESNGTCHFWLDDIEYNSNTGVNINDMYLQQYCRRTADTYWLNVYVRKYTLNEPELWRVGNIIYPEGLNMTCNIKIITHLTEKNIEIVNMTGNIVNTSKTNECINLTYDSYIIYMSNPIKISSFTELLNVLDNFLVQFLLFIFLMIIATLFYVFIQVVKKKGFKL